MLSRRRGSIGIQSAWWRHLGVDVGIAEESGRGGGSRRSSGRIGAVGWALKVVILGRDVVDALWLR